MLLAQSSILTPTHPETQNLNYQRSLSVGFPFMGSLYTLCEVKVYPKPQPCTFTRPQTEPCALAGASAAAALAS